LELLFRFAYPLVLYLLVPLTLVLAYIHIRWKRKMRYHYSLGSELKQQGLVSKHPYKKILFIVRLIILLGLSFLIARPQLIDPKKIILVEGINIILDLDISGSMGIQVDQDDERSRIEVAKEEAIHFINKRHNDAIGLVLFANDTISRCPLTLDKKILNTIVEDIEIGLLDPKGTLLTRSLITSLSRLRKVKKAERGNIIIILTDGSPEGNDLDPQIAIDVAKQLGVKIYTIGIGHEGEAFVRHPLFGLVPISAAINKKLLQYIADETGGKFFMATNHNDMREIYDTIDNLEKVEQDLPLYSHYYDVFMIFLWLILLFLATEIILSSFIWFGL